MLAWVGKLMGLQQLLARFGWFRKGPKPRLFRYERFGGIVQLRFPQSLIFVDRDRARSLGLSNPPGQLWQNEEPQGGELGLLTAPLEAHLQLTNRCEAACDTCYTGATKEGGPKEWGLAQWLLALDALAEQGVFHLALGGGESALLPWLGEVCAHARKRGMIPNLTTSGLYDEAVLQRLCGWAKEGLFGQINVSLDGVSAHTSSTRGQDCFEKADRALRALRKVHRQVGINCVVTRDGFPHLEELFLYAKQRRMQEIELLRLKPAGRAARREVYDSLRCTDAQHLEILPTVLRLSRKHRLRVRMDCSFVPMIAVHKPAPELLAGLSVYGCAGGDHLVAGKATGALAACSFSAPVSASVLEIESYWEHQDAFVPFRLFKEAQEPCQSCSYLSLCRGGCKVVSAHVTGDFGAPDPECPRVIAWHKERSPAGRPGKRLPIVWK